MKRSIFPILLMLVASMGFTQEVSKTFSKDKSGVFGLSVEPVIGFSSRTDFSGLDTKYKGSQLGLNVLGRYGLSNNFQLELGAGFSSSRSHSNTDGFESISSTSGLNVVARGQFLPFSCESPLDMGIIFGVDIFNGTYTYENDLIDPISDDYSSTAIDLGVRVEYHLSNFLSIHNQVSVYVNILPLHMYNNKFDGEDDESGLNLDLAGSNLFGNAGFTFWFK